MFLKGAEEKIGSFSGKKGASAVLQHMVADKLIKQTVDFPRYFFLGSMQEMHNFSIFSIS